MNARPSRNSGPLFFSILSLFAYGGMVRQFRLAVTPLSGLALVQVIGWYLLAFLIYGAALIWVERQGAVSTKWMWGTAIAARLLLLFSQPALSSDVYRYLWDGHVTSHGVSPYAYPIEAAELDYLDVPQRGLANHTWMATPYLPAAQLLFTGVVSLFSLDSTAMQASMILFDLLTAVILARLLRLARLPGRRLILYLWHPLVIVETAHSAHVDAWMVCLTMAAVYLTIAPPVRGSRLLAAGSLALATLTKIVPILIYPLLFWRWSWRQRSCYVLVVIAVLLPAAWQAGWGLTGPLEGTGLFGALRIYNAQWNFNSGLFHWLERALGAPGYGAPLPLAKHIVTAALLIAMLVLFAIGRQPRPPAANLRQWSLPFMVYLLLSPAIHPWYVLILLAFFPFLAPGPADSRWRWLFLLPWLYLSGALTLSYLTYLYPFRPGELEWVRQWEWLPTLGLLAAAGLLAASPARPFRLAEETR